MPSLARVLLPYLLPMAAVCALSAQTTPEARQTTGLELEPDLELSFEYVPVAVGGEDAAAIECTVKREVLLGARKVDKGTWQVGLSRTRDDGPFALRFEPKRKRRGPEAFDVVLGTPEQGEGAPSSPRLALHLQLDAGGTAARLEVAYGGLRASLPVRSWKEHERALAADPAVAAIDAFVEKKGVGTSGPTWRKNLPEPELPAEWSDAGYEWHLATSEGPITLRLLPGVAPKHVASTIYLTRLGFYDGLTFHRVIPGFMAQGGCPDGNGNGGPGYQYDGEFDPAQTHDGPGVLSMANAGPGTDGCQFFLTFGPAPNLDGKHTIFGRLVSGMPALRALEAAGSASGKTSRPLTIDAAVVVAR